MTALIALAIAIPGAAVVGFLVSRFIGERRAIAARVAYVTRQGVTVLKSKTGRTLPRPMVEAVIDECRGFWLAWAAADGAAAAIDAAFKVTTVGCIDATSVTYAGRPSAMYGATVPGHSSIALDAPCNIPNLTGHELGGHICLFALGIPEGERGANHERVMVEAGFHYA